MHAYTHTHTHTPHPSPPSFLYYSQHLREAMINLDSVLESRDSDLPTKVQTVKAMVFSEVIYGCRCVFM